MRNVTTGVAADVVAGAADAEDAAGGEGAADVTGGAAYADQNGIAATQPIIHQSHLSNFLLLMGLDT